MDRPSYTIANWQSKPELKTLLDLSDPPKALFARGKWEPIMFQNCVAVVGSRRMTKYGRQVIDQIVPELVLQGRTIVSGFMYGVDQYAHEAAIKNGGRTIAVLGWGIDFPVTDEDLELASLILSHGGLLLSEWQSQRPLLWTFPVRNRIVAALSKDVIVIEAALKSGSLITANLAKKYQRRLWAIPGPITSKTSAGTNQLIANGDAQIWSNFQGESKATISDHPIIKLLENETLTAGEIARALNLPVGEVGAQLSLLSLENRLVEENGSYSLH